MSTDANLSHAAREAVLPRSGAVPADADCVAGPSFVAGTDDACRAVLDHLGTTGFQATQLSRACDLVHRMVAGRDVRDADRCIIYCGATANLFATGVRDALAYVASRHQLDHVVVSGGAIEHDLRRLFVHHDYRVSGYDFNPAGSGRQKLGNISYVADCCDSRTRRCCFPHVLDDAITALVAKGDALIDITEEHVPRGEKCREPPFKGSDRRCIAPSSFWRAVAQHVDTVMPDIADASFAVQCARNGIPIFSPSFTDGDACEFLVRDERWSIDLVADLNALNRSALKAKKTGMLILGGGVVKHHVCNANLMRNGADLAVFVNTAQEFDGSDGGARPDEAVSWGKIRIDGTSAKVYTEATIAVPIIVKQGFARVEA